MGEPGGFEREFARVEALMREWSLEEATRILEDLERRSGFPNRVRHVLSVLGPSPQLGPRSMRTTGGGGLPDCVWLLAWS